MEPFAFVQRKERDNSVNLIGTQHFQRFKAAVRELTGSILYPTIILLGLKVE